MIQSMGSRSTTFKNNIFSNLLTTYYFNSSIIVALNKIYHKMQFKKLYNLQTKVYFNCILFVFKKRQNSVRLILTIVKRSFFYTNENSFFLFYLFITWYIFLKKRKIYHKIQREKAYNLQNKIYFISVLFMFKTTANSVQSFFATTKIGLTEFCFFLKTKSIQLK